MESEFHDDGAGRWGLHPSGDEAGLDGRPSVRVVSQDVARTPLRCLESLLGGEGVSGSEHLVYDAPPTVRQLNMAVMTMLHIGPVHHDGREPRVG